MSISSGCLLNRGCQTEHFFKKIFQFTLAWCYRVCDGQLLADSSSTKNNPLFEAWTNRSCSIYQYSNLALRLSGQNCKLFTFLSVNSQTKLGNKESTTTNRSLSWKSLSYARIFAYWPIGFALKMQWTAARVSDLVSTVLFEIVGCSFIWIEHRVKISSTILSSIHSSWS